LFDFSKADELNPNIADVKNQKGICLYSLGQFREANKVYKELLSTVDGSNHCWYHNEIIFLLHHTLLDKSFKEFNFDNSFLPRFKEYLCKRSNFNEFLITTNYTKYKQNEKFDDKIKDVDLNYKLNEDEEKLLRICDKIGKRLQLDSPGFSRNKRQHRMCKFINK
jgi:tetratricopeptide (TPR) repeat protein